MSGSKKYIYILGTWLYVMVLLSAVLFMARLIPEAWYFGEWRHTAECSPLGLFPNAMENDPRVVQHSKALAMMNYFPFFNLAYSIETHLNSKINNQVRDTGVDYPKNMYSEFFDKQTGLITSVKATIEQVDKTLTWTRRETTACAGPNGWSRTPDANLGRFIDPIWKHIGGGHVVYDKQMRRFFYINYREGTVTKSDEMAKKFVSVQMGEWTLQNNIEILRGYCSPPQRKGDPNVMHGNQKERQDNLYSLADDDENYPREQIMLVLDEAGYINRLNIDTMKLSRAGYLPSGQAAAPRNLLAYFAQPVRIKGKYQGLVVGWLAQDWKGPFLRVFDVNGIGIEESQWPSAAEEIRRGQRMIVIVPKAQEICRSLMMSSRYAIEILQPAAFGAGSFLIAPSFEAMDGQSAIFILPHSLLGMLGRSAIYSPSSRAVILGVLLLLPSILLGIFLAWRIRVNARMLGLGTRERMWWTVGAIAFGLSAYITYRLTRPRVTLVTCANCGKPRRPDMDLCHKCGAAWHIPEIMPPLWRVVEHL